MIDIGRVFSTSFAVMRQRFWLLVGMWLVFFAIQIGASMVMGIVTVVMGTTSALAMGEGLEDPAAIASMGIGMIAFFALFYAAYIAIVLAQQAAMITLASPLEQPAFGAALIRGFKSVLPFLGLLVLLIVGYFVLVLGVAVVAGGLTLASPDAAAVVGVVMLVLFFPVLIWLGCRLSVVIAVVAVDEVYNPVAALRRSWAVTKGKVIGILLVLIGSVAMAFVIVGVPVLLFIGAAAGSENNPEAAVGIVLFGLLLLLPMFIIYTAFTAAINAALHAEVTDGGAEKLEDVFA